MVIEIMPHSQLIILLLRYSF